MDYLGRLAIMEKNEIREEILRSLETIGVHIAPDEIEDNDDINLQDYFIDSLMFVSAIVQLEQDFSIEFDEEYLNWEIMSSFNSLVDYLYYKKNEDA